MSKRKMFWIAVPLVAVLGVGGAIAGHKHFRGHHNPEHMVQHISETLELTEAQRQKLEAVKDAFVQSRAEMKQEKVDLMNQLIEEVRKPVMDQALVMELIEKRKAKFDVMAPRILGPVIEFHSSLTDEQKQKIVNRLESMRDWGHGRHWGHG